VLKTSNRPVSAGWKSIRTVLYSTVYHAGTETGAGAGGVTVVYASFCRQLGTGVF